MKHLCVRKACFLKARDVYEDAKIVLAGIPLDITGSFRPGARWGPQAIRNASHGLEDYSPYLDQELGECAFYDAGDLILPFGNLQTSFRQIEELCRSLVKDEKFPFFLGGEHLLSFPVVKILAEFYCNLAVLHFDAHADLRNDYRGEIYSHAAVVRRICEIVGSRNVFQFGIRSGTKEEFVYGHSFTNFYPFELATALESCFIDLKGRPLYVTLDIDLVDPAYAPGTGTPEAGGFTSQEVFRIFYILQELQVIGFDLVELVPHYDNSEVTALLAAKLVREGIIAFSQSLLAT